jgi:hypothetical protein
VVIIAVRARRHSRRSAEQCRTTIAGNRQPASVLRQLDERHTARLYGQLQRRQSKAEMRSEYHTHSDTLEPAMAELVVMSRDAYEGLINRTVMASAVERNVAAATRAEIEEREDRETRALAAPCGRP